MGLWSAPGSVTQPTFLYSELGRAGFLPPGSGSVSSSRFLVFLLLLQGEKLDHLQVVSCSVPCVPAVCLSVSE